MAVLTNKPVNPSRDICRALSLEPFFFQNYGGNSFDTKKPDPEGLLTLIAEASAIAGSPITAATHRNDRRLRRRLPHRPTLRRTTSSAAPSASPPPR